MLPSLRGRSDNRRLTLAGVVMGHLVGIGCEAPPARTASSVASPRHTVTESPAGTFDGAGGSLLEEYTPRQPFRAAETARWELPFQAKRLVVGLLAAAAHDDRDAMGTVVARAARWGLPDRREIGARPVWGADQGERFFAAVRAAASRFGQKAALQCPPLWMGAQQLVRTGAEPMWCYYTSGDGLDLLVFKLVIEGGAARIGYVGLFETRPSAPVLASALGPAPPLTPPIRKRPGAAMGASPDGLTREQRLERLRLQREAGANGASPGGAQPPPPPRPSRALGPAPSGH